MNEMIDAQGRRADPPALGALSFEVCSDEAGVVTAIDNLQIATIARLAGAPKVAGAGIDLLRKLGDPVAAGQVLYRVYADYPADLSFARRLCDRASGYSVGDAQAIPRPFVEF